jgi:antitoxin YefM
VKIVNFSEARANLKEVLDRVVADADVTTITRRNEAHVVVMSLDYYNSLMATVHLLKSPKNAAHLMKSIAQAQSGTVVPKELEKP